MVILDFLELCLFHELINFEIRKIQAQFSINAQSPCAIILIINLKGHLFTMGFNVYLGPLV